MHFNVEDDFVYRIWVGGLYISQWGRGLNVDHVGFMGKQFSQPQPRDICSIIWIVIYILYIGINVNEGGKK